MYNLLDFTDIELAIAGGFVGFFFIHFLFLLVVYMRPYRNLKKKKEVSSTNPPVSVIVYANNDSENLSLYLPFILSQDYPQYEVIVVNDGLVSEIEDVITLLKAEHENLYHTYIPDGAKYLSRKKLALTVGIKAAKHDVLLFTEADCKPISSEWIASMMSNYDEQTEVVLGFCSYGSHKGFFHKLVAYDNLVCGLQSLSLAIAHSPYTGNGRNLSYRKEQFFKHKGYSRSLNIHAGDDDLFINEIANSKNTRVEYSLGSIMERARVESYSIWKEMKVSRAGTRRFYKGNALFRYRFASAIFFLFLISGAGVAYLGAIGNVILIGIAVLLYLLHFMTKAIIFNKSAKMLNQKPLTIWLPLMEIIMPIYNMYVSIYRLFRGKSDYTFTMTHLKR